MKLDPAKVQTIIELRSYPIADIQENGLVLTVGFEHKTVMFTLIYMPHNNSLERTGDAAADARENCDMRFPLGW